jgi:hypothetical protein
MSTITKEQIEQYANAARLIQVSDLDKGKLITVAPEHMLELARIALASLEAEPVAYMHRSGQVVTREECCDDKTFAICCRVETPLYTAPPAPVSMHESEPVAYIFKHPAGRLFWSLTDESNKGQRDVMPVYSAPVPTFVPPAIEPDYEVIKGILPTANPDEYACCIAADMWNACRAAMLQGAENAESTTTMQNAPALDSSPKIAESTSGNSPVIPDGGEHGFCQKHPDTRRLTHPYIQLMTYPPRPSIYCPKCDPNVTEWIEMDKKLRIDN